jgi:methionyl-tRNA formyltransferase
MNARVFLISYHYLGVLYIDELLHSGDEIVGVVNWPGETGFNAGWYVPEEYNVRQKAFQNYIPLYEPDPNKLNSEKFLQVIQKLSPDFIISGYYSKIFSRKLLSIPKIGCVNIHPTGLPRYRGLSPYFTHMLFGEDRNYITMHWLNPGVDTGDIIAQNSIEILENDTGFTTGHKLTEAGAAMFREYWPLIKEGKAPRWKQDETMASTFNFSWDMAQIDWRWPKVRIWNLVRSLTKPLGGTWTMIGDRKLHIWSAKVVPETDEFPGKALSPGEVLVFSDQGIWIQCGEGQLQIIEFSLDDLSVNASVELLKQIFKDSPVILG